MLHRAYNYNSDWHRILKEIDHLWDVFSALQYPRAFFDSVLNEFMKTKCSKDFTREEEISSVQASQKPIRFVIPYKGSKQSIFIKHRFSYLTAKVGIAIQPTFVSRKLSSCLSLRELKPDIVNRQCVVYYFQCDQCDAGYVGMTIQHLHQRMQGHMSADSSISKHLRAAHMLEPKTPHLEKCIRILKKCNSKFDCLINEMLFIQKMRPSLNVESDSVKAKFFV